MNTAHDVTRKARWAGALLISLSVALLALASAVLYAELRTPKAWDPLAAYPTQEILTEQVHVDGVVRSVGVKCADEHVEVRGVMSWQAIDPPGANIEVGRGVGVREEGCTRQTFANPIPLEVREVIRAQHAAGIEAPVWRITGIETPFDGVREGVSRTWTTDNFEVTP